MSRAGLMFLMHYFISATTAGAQTSPANDGFSFRTAAGRASSVSADDVATSSQFAGPVAVAADANGNVFVTDNLNSTVRRITPEGDLSMIAGFLGVPGSADETNGAAHVESPLGVAVGSLPVAESYRGTGRRLTPVDTNGSVDTIAGFTGTDGFKDGVGISDSCSRTQPMVQAGGSIFAVCPPRRRLAPLKTATA